MGNSSVSTIFKQVEDAAKVHFTYNPKDLNLQEKITTQIVNKSLPEVMDAIASKIKIKYKIDGETIMLQADEQSSAPDSHLNYTVKYMIVTITLNRRYGNKQHHKQICSY